MSLIVIAQNMSALAPISKYNYQVLVGDGTVERSHLITAGRVTHARADGWKKLIQLILDRSE